MEKKWRKGIINLGLNVTISAHIESMEHHVDISARSGHEEEKEVKVSVGQQTIPVDLVQQSILWSRDLVLGCHPLGIEIILGDDHVGTLALTEGVANGAARGHGVVEVAATHQGSLLPCIIM